MFVNRYLSEKSNCFRKCGPLASRRIFFHKEMYRNLKQHLIQMWHFSKRVIFPSAFICSILLLAFWIRVQGIEQIPEGQFTGTDPYLYAKLRDEIADLGYLPTTDMHRWLPYGRDNGQLLSLYSYVLAYSHKVIGPFFPKLTLYHIQLYSPAVFFTLGLAALSLFLARIYGIGFAGTTALILATLPGSINRSLAGFSDRDAWVWLLAVLAIITYLYKERMVPGWRRYLVTALAGFTAFLGGLSWEAFGLFTAIIVCVEIWKFCSTDTEQYLKEYFLWVFMFVPWLFLISPAYRSGYGFSMHVTELMLLPSLIVLGIRSARHLLLHFFKWFRLHARLLAFGLLLIGIAIGIWYVTSQSHTFALTAYPLHKSRLMQHVSELKSPYFQHWQSQYGGIFVLGSLGLVLRSLQYWRWKGLPLAVYLSLFVGATFFREPLSIWIGDFWTDTVFASSIFLTITGLGIACRRHEKTDSNEQILIATIVWFILWVGLARNAVRHSFFIGVPLAFGTASFLWISPTQLIQKLKGAKILHPDIQEKSVTACIAIGVLVPVLLWAPFGGHATRSVDTAQQRKPIPGEGSLLKTFQWMKTELSQEAVVAATWDFGTQLNMLGGVKTIIDPDHYIQYWIHLYYRHVFCAQTEHEALSFLKTHNVTHLMLIDKEVVFRAEDNSFIGSDKTNDKQFRFHKLKKIDTPIGTPIRMVPEMQTIPLVFIDIVSQTPEKVTVTANFRAREPVSHEFVPNANRETKKAIDVEIGGVILYFDHKRRLKNVYYVPPIGWNSIVVKLFIREEHSNAFVPVYPNNDNDIAEAKVWEIHYPPEIETDDKYLATEPASSHHKFWKR